MQTHLSLCTHTHGAASFTPPISPSLSLGGLPLHALSFSRHDWHTAVFSHMIWDLHTLSLCLHTHGTYILISQPLCLTPLSPRLRFYVSLDFIVFTLHCCALPTHSLSRTICYCTHRVPRAHCPHTPAPLLHTAYCTRISLIYRTDLLCLSLSFSTTLICVFRTRTCSL